MTDRDRVALVTGAASGIGRATVERLRGDGWVVAGVDRAPIPAGLCDSRLQVDITDEPRLRKGIGTLADSHHRFDALVCCAGISGSSVGDGPAGQLSTEAVDAVTAVNLRGTSLTVAACWDALVAGSGSIVIVSSVLGLTGGGGPFRSHAYIATKGALIALTRALAADGRRYGVRANCVAPGLVDTPLAKRAVGDPELRGYVADRQPLTAGPIPARAIADAIAFFCAADSGAVTGQVLAVDAGWGLDPA